MKGLNAYNMTRQISAYGDGIEWVALTYIGCCPMPPSPSFLSHVTSQLHEGIGSPTLRFHQLPHRHDNPVLSQSDLGTHKKHKILTCGLVCGILSLRFTL